MKTSNEEFKKYSQSSIALNYRQIVDVENFSRVSYDGKCNLTAVYRSFEGQRQTVSVSNVI